MLRFLDEEQKTTLERMINHSLEDVANHFKVSVSTVRTYIADVQTREDRYEDIWNYIVDTGEQWTEDYPSGLHSGEVSAIYNIYEDIQDSNYDLWSTIANAVESYRASEEYRNFEFRKDKI
jgi:hypothetical protein